MLAAVPAARALVFGSPEREPRETIPADFPYWENVTQRRYDSPSVVYLGNGFALTARHVGPGEIFVRGEIVPPIAGTRRTLVNPSGSPADAMVFEVALPEEMTDLPLVPIAKRSPRVGEEVLLIGFGRVRENVVAVETDGPAQFGFAWSEKGSKRWGSNRISSTDEMVYQENWSTRSFAMRFDPPGSADATDHEAQATVGDSGGAVFVKRDGEWLLVGLMTSVTGYSRTPVATSMYGDTTYAADLTRYREEILRWARPACSNEQDDDGDDHADYPADPSCASPLDASERGGELRPGDRVWIGLGLMAGVAAVVAAVRVRRRPGIQPD